ncbi:MAG: aminotransferase class V-fold PLP-dependent enzyme, partial [Candidatus Cloacimonas sp.]|nr:aminotransferase class V-fold PLP-dependent enzyme [Candidatus Cloacimonas sp.]
MKAGRIYLDNCITTRPATEVLSAMQPYFDEKFWYPGTFISTGETINEDIAGWQETIAKAIGAETKEIHFTGGGTLANNIAIKGIATANAAQGKHVIVSVVDYPDMLTNAAYLEKNGFEVSYLSADSEGFINLQELTNAIRKDTILFMTTAVNHVVGTIQPLRSE